MLHDLENIKNDGFTVLEKIYSKIEIDRIVELIEATDKSNLQFRKTKDLFAVRGFLQQIPGISELVFNDNLKSLIKDLFSDNYFVVKSIYFDKPEDSNWFVAWHQDLSISVNKRNDLLGYGSWTVKLDKYGVQPPVELLKDNFTIRIHLDSTDKNNGALKVIPGSHLKEIYRVESIDWKTNLETICNVGAGGVMVMRPLLMHASDRSTSKRKRRVIHIEFSKIDLPESIGWAEKQLVNFNNN